MNMKHLLTLASLLMLLCFEPIFAQSLSKQELIALNEKLKNMVLLGNFRHGRAFAVQNRISHGQAYRKQELKYGFINTKGDFVIPCDTNNLLPLPIYDSYPYPEFNAGIFIMQRETNEPYMIRRKGGFSTQMETIIDTAGHTLEELWMKKYIREEDDILYIDQCTDRNKWIYEIYKNGKKFGEWNNIHILHGSVLVSMTITDSANYFGMKNSYNITNITTNKTYDHGLQYLIPLQQNDGSFLFCVGKENKIGIIDENFKEVVPFVFDTRNEPDETGNNPPNPLYFQNGIVLENDGWIKIKDTTGKMILPFDCDRVYVGTKYIFTQRENHMRHRYDDSDAFCEVYDKKGNQVTELPFGKNYFRMKKDFWQLENKQGKVLINKEIDCISDFLWDEYCIANKGDYYFLLNSNGEIVVDSLRKKYRDRDLLMKIYDKKSVKNIGIKGLPIVDAHSIWPSSLSPNNKNIAPNMKFKIWSTTGKYEYLDNPNIKQGPYMLIDPNGKNLTPMGCDWIGQFSDGLILVKIKGRYYYLNEKGEGLPE